MHTETPHWMHIFYVLVSLLPSIQQILQRFLKPVDIKLFFPNFQSSEAKIYLNSLCDI